MSRRLQLVEGRRAVQCWRERSAVRLLISVVERLWKLEPFGLQPQDWLKAFVRAHWGSALRGNTFHKRIGLPPDGRCLVPTYTATMSLLVRFTKPIG